MSATENDAKLLDFFGEEARHNHSVIWQGEQFFSGAISTLIGAGIALMGFTSLAADARFGGSMVLLDKPHRPIR